MKKIFLVLALILGVSSFAQNNLKFAHFDYTKVSDSLPTVLAAKAELDALEKDLQVILSQLEVEFNDAQILFDRDKATLSPVLREIKQKELGELYNSVITKREDYGKQYDARAAELMEPIQKNLEKAIKIVAERNKLNYVFEKSTLMYVNGGTDLTLEIKAELMKLEAARTLGTN